MTTRIRRWRLVVDWKLQASLCAHGVLYGCLVIVAVVCGIFAPLLWTLGGATPSGPFEDQAIVMLYMHDRLWFLVLSCLFIIVASSIKFSHRIAGPLVRYKRNLRLMANGKLPTPLRTRRNDYLKEEVACLNDAVEGIAARVDAIRNAQVAVAREVQGALARTPRAQAAQLEPLLKAAADLERSLAAFERWDTGDGRRPAEIVPMHSPVPAAIPGGSV